MAVETRTEKLTRLQSDLDGVRDTISRIQLGRFESRRGDRYFVMPDLATLRREERRLLRTVQRLETPGKDVRQGVARSRRRRTW